MPKALKEFQQAEALRLKSLANAREVYEAATKGPYEWTPLLEGFTSMQSLGRASNPDGSRVVSDLEKNLQADMEKLRNEVFGKYLDGLTKLDFGGVSKNDRTGKFDFNIDLLEKLKTDPLKAGGRGGDSILRALQDDVLRYAPNAPGPDKLLEAANSQVKKLDEVKQELADWNAFIRGAKKGEFVFIP
jgi:hypothetical protein